jgi:hypothetical protein
MKTNYFRSNEEEREKNLNLPMDPKELSKYLRPGRSLERRNRKSLKSGADNPEYSPKSLNDHLLEKARKILEGKEGLKAIQEFIDSLNGVGRFYTGKKNGLLSTKEYSNKEKERYNEKQLNDMALRHAAIAQKIFYNKEKSDKYEDYPEYAFSSKNKPKEDEKEYYSPWVSTTANINSLINNSLTNIAGDKELANKVLARAPMIGVFADIPEETLLRTYNLPEAEQTRWSKINPNPVYEKEILYNTQEGSLFPYLKANYKNPLLEQIEFGNTNPKSTRYKIGEYLNTLIPYNLDPKLTKPIQEQIKQYNKTPYMEDSTKFPDAKELEAYSKKLDLRDALDKALGLAEDNIETAKQEQDPKDQKEYASGGYVRGSYDPYMNTYGYPYSNTDSYNPNLYQDNQTLSPAYYMRGYEDPDLSYRNAYDTLPSTSSALGWGASKLGASGIGSSLSNYGARNAILPALGMSNNSYMSNMANYSPYTALAQGMNGVSQYPQMPPPPPGYSYADNRGFMEKFGDNTKDYLSQPGNLLTLGTVAAQYMGREKPKTPEQIADEERRYRNASRRTIAEIEADEAIRAAQLDLEKKRKRKRLKEDMDEIDRPYPVYRKSGGSVKDQDTSTYSPYAYLVEETYYRSSPVRYLNGDTGGQDDLIDAKLSDGEYVFDASTVSDLGDGNNAAGARKLDIFRENIRKHKRGGKISLPPKAKSLESYFRG